MYRTFGNAAEDANLAITCFLIQLEARMKAYTKLPPIIYIQIDWGSENVNKYVCLRDAGGPPADQVNIFDTTTR
jgi:hypothetical protein